MEDLILYTIVYLISVMVVFLYSYFDEDVITVRDLCKEMPHILIPIWNTGVMLLTIIYHVGQILDKILDFKLKK